MLVVALLLGGQARGLALVDLDGNLLSTSFDLEIGVNNVEPRIGSILATENRIYFTGYFGKVDGLDRFGFFVADRDGNVLDVLTNISAISPFTAPTRILQDDNGVVYLPGATIVNNANTYNGLIAIDGDDAYPVVVKPEELA